MEVSHQGDAVSIFMHHGRSHGGGGKFRGTWSHFLKIQ